MNILMILDQYFPPDTRVENEALFLIKSGHQVHLLCYRFDKKSNQNEIYKKIIIHRFYKKKNWISKFRPLIGYKIDFYSIYWENKISGYLKKNKIDVMHVHDLYMAVSAMKVKDKYNIPITLDLHENYPAALQSYNWTKGKIRNSIIKPERWDEIEVRLLKKVDKIIVLSSFYKKMICSKYSFINPDHVIEYPNVPNIEQLKSYSIDNSILQKEDKVIIFYFGIVAERRGIFICMEALKILKVKFPNLTFLIIGPVDKIDKKSFMQYIHDKNLKENIIHYNWKDISLFPSYVFCSDICISPLIKNAQHDSGIANKVFQYMLFEKPLIVSDCEPQSELVQEVKCGVVFRSNDINDLVEKIDYLISNPDIRHQLGQNGKIAVINKYNWNNMSRNLLNIYTEELLTI